MSVVLVENDKAVREALRFSLAIEGFDILVYDSAKAFLRDANALSSECLVVDQQMPGMTGIELVAALRQRECLIPSILITTWPRHALLVRALQAGCRVILEKPLKGNVLPDCIYAAIDDARSQPA